MAVNKPVVLSTESTTTTMSIKFGLKSGGEKTLSFKYVKPEVIDEDVSTACATMVQNGDIWEDNIIECLEAKQTQTNTTKYNI